jgi:hypothetical protein
MGRWWAEQIRGSIGDPRGKIRIRPKPVTVRVSEPENRGCKTVLETETTGPENHGYPPRTRSAAILNRSKDVQIVGSLALIQE